LWARVGRRARFSALAVALVAAAVAAVLLARGGSDGGEKSGGGSELPHKVLPNGRERNRAGGTPRSRPKPYGAAWSVFEDHNALIRNGPARRQQTLDELKTLGADTLRVEVKWNEVAPSPTRSSRPPFDAADPGAYRGFAPYDDLFRRAGRMGFRVIADLAPDAPRWATAGGRGYAATANLDPSAAEFGKFAAAVAKRYSGGYQGLPRVGWFSIWNEPNHILFLKPLERAPDIYRAMVNAALPAIRANAGPGVKVLIGETAPAGRAGRSIGPREFIQRFLAGSGRLDVDGWAHHPYGPATSVPAGRDIVNLLAIRRLGIYLDRGARAGALPAHLPIYSTEFGMQSNPPDPTVTTTLAQQAEQLNEKEELSYDYPRLRSYSQYLLYDDPQRPGPRDVAWAGFQTGLRFGQGPPKPAWNAYRLPIVVHARGRGVHIWGRVRPGSGRRAAQLQVLRLGRWQDAARPVTTNEAGFFTANRRIVAPYRFSVAGIGVSRVANPI
jgi:cellulase (glycosyl hydrolase family 5)